MFKFVKARNFFSRLKLNKKFLFMYIFGVILPLIITDAVLFRSVYDAELSNQRNYRKNAIDAYSNHIQSVLQYDANVATAIDLNKDLNSFIDTEYDIPYGYFNSYVYTVSTSFFATLSDIKQDRIVIYSDNESMMSGHYFHNIKEAYNEKWYEQFVKTDANEAAYAYYDSDPIVLTTDRDRFIYVRKMDNAKSALKLTRIITIEHKMTRIYDELKEIPVNCQMLKESTLKIAQALGTEDIQKARYAEYEKLVKDGQKKALKKKLNKKMVICNKNQTYLAKELGLEVVAVFGPGPVSSEELLEAKKAGYDLIIDNIHNPTGKPITEVLPKAKYIEWRNFPEAVEHDALKKVVSSNIDLLLAQF